jgi:hypothetical protein
MRAASVVAGWVTGGMSYGDVYLWRIEVPKRGTVIG